MNKGTIESAILSRLSLTSLEMAQLDHELALCRERARLLKAILAHAKEAAEATAPPRPAGPGRAGTGPVNGLAEGPKRNGPGTGKRGATGGDTKANKVREAALFLCSKGAQRGANISRACGMTSKDVQNALARDPRFRQVGRGLWALAASGDAQTPPPSALHAAAVPEHDERRRARARQLAEDVTAHGNTRRAVAGLKASWTADALAALLAGCPEWFRDLGDGAEVEVTGRGLKELLGRGA